MRVMGSVLALSFGLAATASTETKCGDLKQWWANVFKPAFGAQGKINPKCTNYESQFARALALLRTARPRIYRWSASLIEKTEIIPEDSDANATMDMESRTMTLFNGFFEKPIEDQAATIVHEASHNVTENHVECVRGAELGSWWGCDAAFTADWKGGAYNYHFMALHALRNQTKNHHDIKKAAIDTKTRYMLLNKFNDITYAQIREWGGKELEETARWQDTWEGLW